MKKVFYFLSAVLITLMGACDDTTGRIDDGADANGINVTASRYVSKIESSYYYTVSIENVISIGDISGKNVYEMEYASRNTLTGCKISEAEYSGGQKINEEKYSITIRKEGNLLTISYVDPLEYTRKISATLNDNGAASEINYEGVVIYESDGNKSGREEMHINHSITYSNGNFASSDVSVDGPPVVGILLGENTYTATWNNGNLTRISWETSSAKQEDMSFGNTLNADTNLDLNMLALSSEEICMAANPLINLLGLSGMRSRNYILESTGSSGDQYKYEFTLDADGYPTKIVQKKIDNGVTLTVAEHIIIYK